MGTACATSSVALADHKGWSLCGAPWLQPVATGSKRDGAEKRLTQAKTVAVMVRNAMKKGLPSDTLRLVDWSYREEARFDVVRRFGSQPQASRLPSARRRGSDRRGWCRAAGCRRPDWPDATTRSPSRADPRSDRVDERRAVRARST